VHLKLGTRHKKDSLHREGEKAERRGFTEQSEFEVNRRIRSEVPQDESQVSVGGLLALGYESKRRSRKKRKNVNCVEDKCLLLG
jgi:hypothetical protein